MPNLSNIIYNMRRKKIIKATPPPPQKKRVKFKIPNKVKNIIAKEKPIKTQVITFAKKTISLAQFRHEELALANLTPDTLGTSFLQLFKARLAKIPMGRERVQITLSVNVANEIQTKSKGIKKTTRKTLIIQQKTYGPFKTSIPKLINEDMHKFMVYTLLKITLPCYLFKQQPLLAVK